MAITDITDQTFQQEVLDAKRLVLMDVHMEAGCGPCRGIAPKLAEIANDLSAELKVVKLDYQHNDVVVKRFAITAFPTLLVFANGSLRGIMRGNQPMEVLQKWIGPFVAEYVAGEQRRLAREAQKQAESQKTQSA
ncbi:MAG: thioredoxin domain-containing protein [Gammaproteobacteria bacterium]